MISYVGKKTTFTLIIVIAFSFDNQFMLHVKFSLKQYIYKHIFKSKYLRH